MAAEAAEAEAAAAEATGDSKSDRSVRSTCAARKRKNRGTPMADTA
jgi:hypothetical protein